VTSRPTIILVAGKMRSGKDTFSDLVTQIFPWNDERKFLKYSFATKLKDDIEEFLGLEMGAIDEVAELKKAVRPTLIAYGQYRRWEDENYWVDADRDWETPQYHP